MKFEPSATNDRPVLPAGIYRATVMKAEEQLSKIGNSMIKLTLDVLDSSGQTVKLFDYLVGSEKATWKIQQFCVSAGLDTKFEAGELAAIDCEGVEVQAQVVAEETAEFGTQNRIKKYLGTPYSRVA
jgi:hypothetical protein